jgi:hypothetical protein
VMEALRVLSAPWSVNRSIARRQTVWLAVGWVNWSAHGRSKWAGLIYSGQQGIRVRGLVAAIQFEFGMYFSLPLEPVLARCGWHCPHHLVGSFGN